MEALREVARGVHFATLGVPAVVAGVETRIIWLTPATEGAPTGAEIQRAEARRVMAVRRDHVAVLARGAVISCTEPTQAQPITWRVDSVESVLPDHWRVMVVPA